MQKKNTCCHYCQEREVGCHATCKTYIAEHEAYVKEREEIKAKRNKESAILSAIIDGKRRVMRSK